MSQLLFHRMIQASSHTSDSLHMIQNTKCDSRESKKLWGKKKAGEDRPGQLA
jgi:hypothetical protein